jgi:hypothetical protein
MADTHGVIQSETEISNVLVQPINEQQPTVAEERIENDDVSIKENISNDTITNIHLLLFDILAFFSNSQSNVIAEYCQERQNV